jgi:hypothetical protein
MFFVTLALTIWPKEKGVLQTLSIFGLITLELKTTTVHIYHILHIHFNAHINRFKKTKPFCVT